MKVIILAAGTEEIEGINSNIPKCLIQIGKESILERQIKIFHECNIYDIRIIVGKFGKCWTKENHRKIKQICKNMIINEKNLTTKNAFSLYYGIKDIEQGPIIAVDGDIVFKKETILSLLNSNLKTCVLSRKINSLSEKGIFIVTSANRVIDIGQHIKLQKFPEYIFSGIIKIGNDTFSKIKKLSNSKKYRKIHIADILRDISSSSNIYNFDPHDTDSSLKGGSYAKTKKIVLIRKEAVTGKEKLRDEILWIKNLPLRLKKHFVCIKHYDIDSNPVYYEMPYYDFPSLRKLLLNGSIDSKSALDYLNEVMDFMFSDFYTRKRKKSFDNYAQIIHINRVKSRLKEAAEMSPIFIKILQCRYFIINNHKIPNIFLMLRKIENNPDLLSALQPEEVCMVHGDIHFDNILIESSKDNKLKNFILVDPRGLDYTYDLTYDLGKIWHSFYGFYDFFHENLFDMEYDINEGVAKVKLTLHDCPALNHYKSICKNFELSMKSQPLLKKDPNWKMKVLFSNMCHFCSMIPFHLKQDNEEKIALGIFFRGLELFKEFLDQWCKEEYPEKEELSTEWFNINTFQDYLKAIKTIK